MTDDRDENDSGFDILFEPHMAWLSKRCRHAASSRAQTSAHELYNETYLRARVRAAKGWFDQQPTVSISAQMRTLLGNCLRHELTRLDRESAKRAGLPANAGDDEHMVLDPPDPRPVDLVQQLDLDRFFRPLGQATNGPRALCLLSRWRPSWVALPHMLRSAAYTRGGSAMPTRDPQAALVLLRSQRQDLALVADEPLWLLELGRIYRSNEPLDTVPNDEAERGKEAVRRSSRRGLTDLVEWLSREPDLDGQDGEQDA